MPTYTFRNKETEEEHDAVMRIALMEEYLRDNPNMEIVIKPVQLVDPYSVGRMKTDSQYRERMQQIKQNNRGSTIKTGNLTTL